MVNGVGYGPWIRKEHGKKPTWGIVAFLAMLALTFTVWYMITATAAFAFGLFVAVFK